MKYHDIQLTGSLQVTGSLAIPTGTTAERPSNPNSGSIRLNSSNGRVEIYTAVSGSEWQVVGAQTTSSAPSLPDPNVEYLVVAGGGGSAYDGGGGAGAGGLLSSSIDDVVSGSVMTVTVGAGGAAYANGIDSTLVSTSGTSFSTVTSIGGGNGSGAGASYTAGNGGSGGGGAGGQYNNPGGTGTAGQGNAGGTSGTSGGGTTYPGSGGGGAGAVGGAGVNSGGAGKPGGIGKQTNITGAATYFAGGGGGASGGGGGGAGGDGGGGAGGNSAIGTAGTANTGGGAGGSNITTGVTGGSGVVILAYPSASLNAGGGIVGDAGNGRKYHQFNESGTFKVGSTSDFQIHTSNLVMHVDAGNFASRNGNTSGIDLSGYGNDLDFSGQSGGSLSDSFWWEGRSGGIADFDRNGASSASNVAHTGYGTFTGQTNLGFCIDFWIKTTASGGWASGGKTIIGRNNGDIYSNITIYNNKLNFNHYPGSWQNESSTTSINDGNWHHCVLNNYSSATMDIWVDGVKENTGADSSISSGRYFKMDSLGRGYNSENTDMDIGQIRVYDASLTDAQILQNYNATKTNFV